MITASGMIITQDGLKMVSESRGAGSAPEPHVWSHMDGHVRICVCDRPSMLAFFPLPTYHSE